MILRGDDTETEMIPELVSFVTRREGRKFRNLSPDVDDSVLHNDEANVKDGVSLYVHIPFCRSLCPFCCFNRYLFDEELARHYYIDLKKELELYVKRGFNFSSIYFGGGTPTVLMDELAAFVGHLRTRFDVREISLETTPRELTGENIGLLKDMGINRLSIGVQSFEEPVLKTMGRVNGPADEVKERLLMAEGQFDTLNVDFVFNFPGQTVGQFAADVAAFKELNIDQATFYPLMASPHKKDEMERRFNRVDNSREKQFYDIILRELYHGDYQASTAWCFSRGERMIDEYIIEYDDYIGIGSGSVSIMRGDFFVNSFSLDRYHAFTAADKLPIVGWRSLSEKETLRYYLLTKLFGMKLDMEAMQRRFGNGARSKLWTELAFFKTFGLVSGNGVLHVTDKGMYPVSVAMRDFFAALNTLREHCIEHQI
ncbi:MAG: coproporphyrinogen III oxidase family protein [Dehalococcoidales bacterium]|nr:coproporphyrinogen III oxidase family protein [Dehalococcoidales bacterium]